MSSKWRRFEVLLPLRFNDGREVPAEWLADAVLEIVDHFGAASYETQKVEGHWRHSGVIYRDNLVRLVVQKLLMNTEKIMKIKNNFFIFFILAVTLFAPVVSFACPG